MQLCLVLSNLELEHRILNIKRKTLLLILQLWDLSLTVTLALHKNDQQLIKQRKLINVEIGYEVSNTRGILIVRRNN